MNAAIDVRSVGARIDRMPFSAWHYRTTGLVGSARFFDAVDTTALAFVLPVIVVLWKLSPTEAGLLLSASYVGQFVGAILGGLLAERIGRIVTLRLCLVGMAAASIACAFSPGYGVLFALRVVQGVALGGEVPVSAAYMNEICPARYRARAIVAIQLLFGIGLICTSLLAIVLIPNFGWQSMFIAGGLPVITAILMQWLPESPRWLASKGRSEQAESALDDIERKAFREAPVAPLPAAPAMSEAPARKPSIGALLAPDLRRATWSAWIVALCAPLISYVLIGWMPTIYQNIYHLPLASALRYSALSGLMSLGGAALAIIVIDRFGPKRSMTVGLAGAACSTALLALTAPVLTPLIVAAIVSVTFVLIALPITGLFAYSAELYPTPVRAFGVGVASSWVRIAAIIVPPIAGMLLTWGGMGALFGFLAVAGAVGAAGVAWLGVETGGRSRDAGVPVLAPELAPAPARLA